MLKILYRQVGKYKLAALLTPLFTALEVVMDVLIPWVTARLIDLGINAGDMAAVYRYGGLMVVMALLSLAFGILAGRFSAYASTGFAANLRSAMYRNIQTFSFSNIDKYSTAGLVTRMTTDVQNLQQAFQQILRVTVNYFNEFDGFWMIGLTPHSLYTSRAEHLKCDTLIIDEAGQMAIPLALMGMIRAKKVILAGDHKQLPPIISSEEMAEEMKNSIFQALITDDNCTMLDTSFRMYEPICNFVSELFYEGKVKPMRKGCGNLIVCDDPLFDFHTPIIIHHVDDDGEQISDKEASFIADTIAGFLNKGLPADEIAVLSPFRAQAANVRRHIRKNPDISEEQRKHVVADTIDKMQGQEREVIIFSLVAGDIDYMTDMAEFLYNPNKLNVAFSRAKSKLIIVGNIEQIKKISSVEYPHIKKMIESNLVKFV